MTGSQYAENSAAVAGNNVSNREQDIAQVLEAADIARRYAEGTLPHALLTTLLADENNPGDANLALQLIEDLTN